MINLKRITLPLYFIAINECMKIICCDFLWKNISIGNFWLIQIYSISIYVRCFVRKNRRQQFYRSLVIYLYYTRWKHSHFSRHSYWIFKTFMQWLFINPQSIVNIYLFVGNFMQTDNFWSTKKGGTEYFYKFWYLIDWLE